MASIQASRITDAAPAEPARVAPRESARAPDDLLDALNPGEVAETDDDLAQN